MVAILYRGRWVKEDFEEWFDDIHPWLTASKLYFLNLTLFPYNIMK